MKIAVMADDGTVSMYGNAVMGGAVFTSEKMGADFDAFRQEDGSVGHTFAGRNAKEHLINFFGLNAVKKGQQIAKSRIRKGDLIRIVDHGTPPLGERDYRTIEYVAAEDGDISYLPNVGETFYLIDRPKPELPTTPGSVVKAHLKRDQDKVLRTLTLGNDLVWSGPSVRASVKTFNSLYELVEVVA